MLRFIGARFHSRRQVDDGWALLGVIGLAAVLLTVVATSLTVTVSGMQKSKHDQDWNGALAAAYAGVQEYQSRLANDSTYHKYGNPAAPFSQSSAAVLSLPTGRDANPAFEIGASGRWAEIKQANPEYAVTSYFRYEVDASRFIIDGILRLRSTGKVGGATQTIIADLRQKGFIDFLYFTDYETLDPEVFYPGPNQNCERYAWATPTRTSNCLNIQFGSGDVINGPLHSNDKLVVCGGTFNGPVTTRAPGAAPGNYTNACTGTTTNWNSGQPVYDDGPGMPKTNAEMRKETRPDLPQDVPRPGCLYTGPTQVTLLSNGRMNIKSPLTKVTQPSKTAGIANRSPAQCGAITALQSAAGAEIPVLTSNLMYVQTMPGAGDPNNWTSLPNGFCQNRSGLREGWTVGSTVYPRENEIIPDTAAETSPAYGCTNGDAYVSGTMNGAMTIGAENYVYVTGNITYGNDDSILGLVGQNAVWVHNPMVCTRGTVAACTRTANAFAASDRVISAAVLSVAHTFMVQNYDKGAYRGKLTVFGAIAQKYRGTVATTSGGTFATGYRKDYNYDSRLRHTAPPKFLTPVSTTYGVTQFASVPAAFRADGTQR